MEIIKKVIEILTEKEMTISTMESCTGGGVANEITNIEGASEVFKFGAVTYSNEFKIKMGVDPEIIKKYTVYSEQTAESMAKTISLYTQSDYGIGITGKLKRIDKNNIVNTNDDIVFISIYSKLENKFYNIKVKVYKKKREENKLIIINLLTKKLKEILK